MLLVRRASAAVAILLAAILFVYRTKTLAVLLLVGNSLQSAISLWWHSYLQHWAPVLIATVLALGAGIVLAGLVLRAIATRPVVVISDFEISKECASRLGVTGRSLAALFSDELLQLARIGAGGEQNFDRSLVGTGQLPLLPIGLSDPFGLSTAPQIEVKGISWARVVSEWKRIRERQIVVSGDLISGPERAILAGRVSGKWSWRTEPFLQAEIDLQSAVRTLAILALRDIYTRMSGLVEIAEGRTEEGIKLLKQALIRRPSDVFAVEQLAHIYGKQGRSDEAIALLRRFKVPWYRMFERAVLNKSFSMAYLRKDKKKAIKYARRAVWLAPREVLLQRYLAQLCAVLGLRREALRACRRAKKLAPWHPGMADLEEQVEAFLATAKKKAEAGGALCNRRRGLLSRAKSKQLIRPLRAPKFGADVIAGITCENLE
jgi:tetratricopeptide (TPR) repeat protein